MPGGLLQVRLPDVCELVEAEAAGVGVSLGVQVDGARPARPEALEVAV
ncbi:MAG: hypothetical protein ABWK01_05970 [Infirmifilum sp.]